MSCTCSGVSKCAWSTTRPVSCGNVCAATGVANATSASHRTARRWFTSARVEIDGRRGLRSRRGLERHLGLGAVEDLGADRVGEGADAGVISLHRRIIVAPRGVDAVLGSLELILKREEVLVRF